MVSRIDLELNMKTRWNPLVVGGCNVIGVALLALSVTAGGSAVRAAGDATLDSVALEPLMKLADVFSQRIAKIEASVAAVKDSLNARRAAAQELCVADDSGAQTCITKAQLDALLKGAVRTAQNTATPAPAQAPEPAAEPRPSASQACPEKCIAPDVAVTEQAPAVTEVTAKETPATEAAGVKEPVPPAEATAAAKETPTPVLPPSGPTVSQPQAAADETAVPSQGGATDKSAEMPAETPAETKVATVGERAEAAPATTGLAEQEHKEEPKADPAAEPELRE
jgi:hypothetical protein